MSCPICGLLVWSNPKGRHDRYVTLELNPYLGEIRKDGDGWYWELIVGRRLLDSGEAATLREAKHALGKAAREEINRLTRRMDGGDGFLCE